MRAINGRIHFHALALTRSHGLSEATDTRRSPPAETDNCAAGPIGRGTCSLPGVLTRRARAQRRLGKLACTQLVGCVASSAPPRGKVSRAEEPWAGDLVEPRERQRRLGKPRPPVHTSPWFRGRTGTTAAAGQLGRGPLHPGRASLGERARG